MKISSQLSTISRNQKYFRTRENRNFSTVRSTERRIFNFSIIESLMIVGMAGLQVFVVRFFFQGARKGRLLPTSFPTPRDMGLLTLNRLCLIMTMTTWFVCIYCLLLHGLGSFRIEQQGLLVVAPTCNIGIRYLPNAYCCDGLQAWSHV